MGIFVGFFENPTAFAGGWLVPVPWAIADLSYATDGAGELQLPLASTGGAPLSLYVQAVILNGSTLELSNALEVEIGI